MCVVQANVRRVRRLLEALEAAQRWQAAGLTVVAQDLEEPLKAVATVDSGANRQKRKADKLARLLRLVATAKPSDLPAISDEFAAKLQHVCAALHSCSFVATRSCAGRLCRSVTAWARSRWPSGSTA